MKKGHKQKLSPKIVDLMYKKKVPLEEEFSIFRPRDTNVTVDQVGITTLTQVHGSLETDANDEWVGSIILRQTEYDFVDVEIQFAGRRDFNMNVPVSDGVMHYDYEGNKLFRYSFSKPAKGLFMSIEIYKDITRIQFPPGRININSKGYSTFDPHFTSILLEIPKIHAGFKNAHFKKPAIRPPSFYSEPAQRSLEEARKAQEIIFKRMNSDEGRQNMQKMQEIMKKQQMEAENQRMKWVEQKEKSMDKCEAGFTCLAEGNIDEAIGSFKDAISLDFGNTQARHDLWDAYDNFKKDYKEAEKEFKRLIELNNSISVPLVNKPLGINWVWDWLYFGLSVYRQEYYLEAGLYFSMIAESIPSHFKDFPRTPNVNLNPNPDMFNRLPDYNELSAPFEEAETLLNDIRLIPMDIINDKKNVRWPILPHDEIRWSKTWFDTDCFLLMKLQRMLKITDWIKLDYIAKYLNLSEDDLLAKIKMWGEELPLKIEHSFIFYDREFDQKEVYKDEFLTFEREEIRKRAVERSLQTIESIKCRRCNNMGDPYAVIQNATAMLACSCNFCESCIDQVRIDHFRNIYIKYGTPSDERIKLIFDKWKALGLHKGISDKELYKRIKRMVEQGF